MRDLSEIAHAGRAMSNLTAEPQAGSGRVQATKATNKKPWKRTFLQRLRLHGRVNLACREADVDRSWVARTRRTSKRFDRACELALAEARKSRVERFETELERRAVDGWDEPIVSNGQIIGQRKRYDGKLLLSGLEAEHKRKWGKRQQSNAPTVSVMVSLEARTLLLSDPAVAEAACVLSAARWRPGASQGPSVEAGPTLASLPPGGHASGKGGE